MVKSSKLSFPSRSETRMHTLTISIEHSIGSPRHSNQKRKRNKRHTIWKGKVKLLLFANGIILYMVNPKVSTNKLGELIHEFSKVAG